MKQSTLLRYYQRLLTYPVDQIQFVKLGEIAELLIATPRHTRTVLNHLQQAGWLRWKPQAGRGKRAELILLFNQDRLTSHLAEQAIIQGDPQHALVLLDGDRETFGRLLMRHSGVSNQDGMVRLRLTYSRSFAPFLPHLPQRNAERFFCRQLYSGLVQCDPEGNISADLCHCWESFDQAKRWRFHLRPALHFQDGSGIRAQTLVDYFMALKKLPVYQSELAHLENCSTLSSLCLEFRLSRPDRGFAGLLADPRYLIQPSWQLHNNMGTEVIGSGPFRLTRHDADYIELQASDDYYASRALADQVQVWQVDSLPVHHRECQYMMSGQPASGEPAEAELRKHSRKESGCQFLLFNHVTTLNVHQRRWLSQLLGPQSLVEYFSKQDHHLGLITAYNLLPDWRARMQIPAQATQLPDQLSLAYFEHQELKRFALAFQKILAKQGCELHLSCYSYQELMDKALDNSLNQDLILDAINLDENRPASAMRWLATNPILALALTPEFAPLYRQSLHRIQAELELSEHLVALESVANSMQEQALLQPLFHHRQRLRFGGDYRGVKMTDWGWPRIKDIWVTPDASGQQ